MNKISIIIACGLLMSMNACSSDGAYSEEEKLSQDSSDTESQEEKFKKLEQMGSDTSVKFQQERVPVGNGEPMNSPQSSGVENPAYIPPQPPPPPGSAPPEPKPQNPRK